jgi:uncharacterized SAM-binding protein YcdF (DUF218 family)
MVFVSKVCTALFLPPGCIISGLVFFAVFFPRRRGPVMLLAAGIVYLLSVEPVKDLLLKPLEDAYPPFAGGADGSEALVVLGGGGVQASPEAGGGDTLSGAALKRLVYAFGLRDSFTGPYLAAGGRVFDRGQEAEAEAAFRLLVSLGLPSSRVLKETESGNTWENAKNTARLFGFKRNILVTSAYHMRRSVFCFENNGFSVIPAPADYLCSRASRRDVFSFLPSHEAFSGVYTALHEYLGLLYYRLAYP